MQSYKMIDSKRQILITTALTYANGEIHLGHLLEVIQADIWKRFQIMRKNTCYYICGSDAHGAPIMLAAAANNESPEEMVARVREDHMQDYNQFHINFDHYDTTHSDANKKLTAEIYLKLKSRDDISKKITTQFYDPDKKMFLADRYIRGECPQCGAKDQYGDNCEKCGATYNAIELKNPRSVVSGAKPIEKESEHYFFELNHYADFLQDWTQSGVLQVSVANKLKEWFTAGLQAWNISRDAPYFGFEMPDHENKYFYVWLDAPIGYISGFKNFLEKHQDAAHHAAKQDLFWKIGGSTELYHFIGKDIINFHTLFWPAMLTASDYRLPSGIIAHGFLTVNGEKMSKSRGTFITAKTYLKNYPAEYLRYYFAVKLNNQVEDIDFNLNDFCARVNADLVGKYVNLASRSAGFITKQFNGKLADKIHDEKLLQEFVSAEQMISEYYENLH